MEEATRIVHHGQRIIDDTRQQLSEQETRHENGAIESLAAVIFKVAQENGVTLLVDSDGIYAGQEYLALGKSDLTQTMLAELRKGSLANTGNSY